jgi:enoyl-CoA hydratase/carnithine racemase
MVEALVVEVPVHTVEPRRDPAAARLEKPDAQARMTVDDIPRDDLLSEARRKSEQLAAFNHDALWMTKRTIQRAASMSPVDALEMAGDASLVMRLHAPRGGS